MTNLRAGIARFSQSWGMLALWLALIIFLFLDDQGI